jgi:bacteriocin biosynthesis cyclodehydratase domain-containing protein
MPVHARHLPERPLLKPWYRLAYEGDRVLFHYGESLLTVEGKAAVRLLPALLPLLDGTRTVDDIAAYLGEPVRPAIDKALRLFQEHFLLTNGPLPDAAGPLRRSAEFLAATDPGGGSVEKMLETLQGASAGVIGSGPLAEEVARLLRLSGVGGLDRLDWDASPDSRLELEVVVAAPSGEELLRLVDWNRAALAARSPWLQLLPFDGRFVAIGPLYVPGETACFECYRLRRASNLDYPSEFLTLEQAPARHPAAPTLDRAVAGFAATLVLRWLVHRDQFLPGLWYALEHEWELRLNPHFVYRVPRCSACSDLDRQAPPLPWHEGERNRHG